MKSIPHVDEGLTSLENSLQVHILTLQSKLAGPHTSEEIEAEVRIIHELVKYFVRLDRWFEKLLDSATATAEIAQICEQLPDPAQKIAKNREQLSRLHSVSHQLIERSVLLVINAQRSIGESERLTKRWGLEVCGFCEGFGRTKDALCPSCKGERSLLVHQPPIKCLLCHGTGQPDEGEPSVDAYGLCVACRGSGWALSPEREDRP